MDIRVPRFLIFGKSNENKLQLVNSLKCKKLYDNYFNDIDEPFVEYGYTFSNDNPYILQAIFIICPDINYTDELMKNIYFKNVVSFILCCDYSQQINTLHNFYQMITKYSVFTYNDIFLWFIEKKEDDILLTIRNSVSCVFDENDNNFNDRINDIIEVYYKNTLEDMGDPAACNIL